MTRIALAVVLLMTSPLAAQIDEGDRHYAARAQGAQGARANSERIDAAIAAYESAIASNPNDLEAHWKLVRAWRFKGAYASPSKEQKRKTYGSAKTAGQRGLTLATRLLAAQGVKAGSSASQIASAARKIPGLAELYLWDAVNWGEWALAYGKLAAAREGAADRIRREATIAMLISPGLEGGAPSRVLGRLHDQTPRIPFLTGWASSKEALRFLEDSLRIDPSNKLTKVFLAEALLSSGSPRTRAQQLLQSVVTAANDPRYEVEDRAATEDARRLLNNF